MKKLYLLIFVILFCDKEIDSTFRNASWLMSMEEVKKTEKGKYVKEFSKDSAIATIHERGKEDRKLYKQVSSIVYIDTIVTLPCYISYYFIEDKLVDGEFDFVLGEYTTDEYGYSYFNKLKDILTRKHGKPRFGHEHDEHWSIKGREWYPHEDEIYKLYGYGSRNNAIKKGDLSYKVWWIWQDTRFADIKLILCSDSLTNGFSLNIRYKSGYYWGNLGEKVKVKKLTMEKQREKEIQKNLDKF